MVRMYCLKNFYFILHVPDNGSTTASKKKIKLKIHKFQYVGLDQLRRKSLGNYFTVYCNCCYTYKQDLISRLQNFNEI